MRIETVLYGEYPNYERRVIVDGRRASKAQEGQVLELVGGWKQQDQRD